MTITMASVTAGLKRPPEMRKKIQTLTMSEKPKHTEMYIRTMGLKPLEALVVEVLLPAPMLATWVPAKAKKRKRVVPTNSAIVATKSGRFVSVVWVHENGTN